MCIKIIPSSISQTMTLKSERKTAFSSHNLNSQRSS